jgi:hypothetical protein
MTYANAYGDKMLCDRKRGASSALVLLPSGQTMPLLSLIVVVFTMHLRGISLKEMQTPYCR